MIVDASIVNCGLRFGGDRVLSIVRLYGCLRMNPELIVNNKKAYFSSEK